MSQPSAAPAKPLSTLMMWIVALTLAMANFMAILDITIANVVLPTIAGSLGITPNQAVWMVTSYAVAEAVAVPLTGWLAGRFGGVRVMAVSMAFFGVFSIVCGMANSLAVLIIGRVMQGWCGGLMVALSQTLLLKVFPREQAGAAMAVWTIPTLMAPILGPVIGGWLCETFSWRLIFLVNIPIAVFCCLVIWRLLMPFEEKTTRTPVDVIGFVLLVTFVGALQLMLDLGRHHDWLESVLIRWLAGIAAVGFVAFLMWELTDKHPIVDLRVFRHRGFATAATVQAMAFGAMFAGNVLTPLWLQTYMGYTATAAGTVSAWNSVLGLVMAPVAGLFVARFDGRAMATVGLIWIVCAMWLRANVTTDMTYLQISMPLLLMGGGLSVAFVPLTTMTLGSVRDEEMASAAGIQNFMRTIMGAFATSIGTTAWDYRTTHARAALAGDIDRDGSAFATLESLGMSDAMAVRTIDGIVQTQSAVLGLNQVMLVVTGAFAACALLVWLTPKPSRAVNLTQPSH